LITFTFTGVNKIVLSAATNYCIAMEYSGGDVSNYVVVGYDSTSPTDIGNLALLVGASWSAQATRDLCFYVYGNVTSGRTNVTRNLAASRALAA
jgi:hypothetical protein